MDQMASAASGKAAGLSLQSILLLAISLSYVPQYRRILTTKSSEGLSHTYFLLNSIAPLHQLVLIGFNFLMPSDSGSIIRDHPSPGDWLSLAQVAVNFLLSTGLFGLAIRHPSTAQEKVKRRTLAGYGVALVLLLVPLIGFLIHSLPGNFDYEGWVAAAFSFYFALFVPISTGLICFSPIPQKKVTRDHGMPGSLSTNTLLSQAVLYPLLGVSWIWRLPVSQTDWQLPLVKALVRWYFLAGWSSVDSIAFAVVQAYLYWVCRQVKRQAAEESNPDAADERRPLLDALRVGAV